MNLSSVWTHSPIILTPQQLIICNALALLLSEAGLRFYLRGENSGKGMHTDLVSLSLDFKFPICKLETKSLQKPVAGQGVKPASQPSTAGRGVPQLPVPTPAQERQLLPQPVARHEHEALSISAAWRQETLRFGSTFHHRLVSHSAVINC